MFVYWSVYVIVIFFMFYDSGIVVGLFVLGIVVGILGYLKLYFVFGIFVFLIIFYYKWIVNLC